MCTSSDPALLDEARVRTVYARRRSADPRYSCFTPGNLYMLQERERHILALLRRRGADGLAHKRILDIGCGNGYLLRDLVKWGASPERLSGIDLLPERLAAARRLCPPGVALQCASVARLPYIGGQFDLVFQSTVFTALLEADTRRQAAREMLRVLKPDGFIVWYDFLVNSPRNADVRAVGRHELRGLFAGCRIELHRITLAPPLLRAIAPYSWSVSHVLSAIPWLCTHHLAAIQRAEAAA